jgi:CheY-like chemotaxis protein
VAKKNSASILIVDDEDLFRESLIEAAGLHDPSWTLYGAEHGAAALDILDRSPIDLLVTDLRMPVMDGFELLAAVSERPQLPHIFVVSAHMTPESRGKLARLGSLACISKPVDVPKLLSYFTKALGTRRSAVDGLTLSGFAQLLEIERKTCLLRAWRGARTADLLFRKGELVDASLDDLRGLAAAMEVLTWSRAHLEVLPSIEDNFSRTIEEPLSWLLLESARLLDERHAAPGTPTKQRRQEAPATARTEPAPNALQLALQAIMHLDGGAPDLDVEVAAAANATFVRAKRAVLEQLGLDDRLEDIVVILTSQIHVIRPLPRHDSAFLYVAFDRSGTTLALAQLGLRALEAQLEVALTPDQSDRSL